MKTITADLLKVAKIAAKDGVRPILSGVLITPTHYVATDSYKMLKVERTGLDADEFPIIPGSGDPVELKDDDEIVISASQLLKKQKFNKNSTLPVLDEAIISNISRDEEDKIQSVEIATTDLETASKIVYTNLANENSFPQYEQTIPTNAPKAKVKINPKQLIELLQQFDDTVEIELRDEGQPIILRQKGMLGLLMPKRY